MPEINASRYTVNMSWDDIPHLSEQAKKDLYEGTPPHLRESRSEGIPSLGSGAVYPVSPKDITCSPFAIPSYWRRCYGLDVGWKRTAAVWEAEDPTTGVRYAFAEHYMGEALPVIHAAAIKVRGSWIPGAVDPAARGRSQADGKRLFSQYADSRDDGGQELKLSLAVNDVEAGIYQIWQALATGRLKIFTTLSNLLNEYRIYHRIDGKIIKQNDHALDALRYADMTFDRIAIVKPVVSIGKGGNRVADKLAGY